MKGVEKKIVDIKELFPKALAADERYGRLIALGRRLAPYPEHLKIAANQVQGCQSILYLSSETAGGKLFFTASSDALISAGLAALLILVYSGESPETILNTPPSFLAELGILSSLTLSRSNGLAHIHQRMKQDALKALLLASKELDLNSAAR
jgi:cysteine desulfuration protein SufE